MISNSKISQNDLFWKRKCMRYWSAISKRPKFRKLTSEILFANRINPAKNVFIYSKEVSTSSQPSPTDKKPSFRRSMQNNSLILKSAPIIFEISTPLPCQARLSSILLLNKKMLKSSLANWRSRYREPWSLGRKRRLRKIKKLKKKH